MDNNLDKPLPSNEDAERILLGLVFLRASYMELLAPRITENDFYAPQYRRVYGMMYALYLSGTDINPITISEELKRQGSSIDSMGGVSAIAILTNGLPALSEREYEDHIKTVKGHSVARDLLFECARIQRDILSGVYPIEQIAEEADSVTSLLNKKVYSEGINLTEPNRSIAEITPKLYQMLDDFHKGIQRGVKTGMPEIDKMLAMNGLQPDALYVIGAGEKVGKTSLVLDWSYDVAIVQGQLVIFITLEMSQEMLTLRLYSAHSGIPFGMFRPGIYDSPDNPIYTRAVEGLGEFAKIPIEIVDSLFGFEQIRRFLLRRIEKSHKPNQRKIGLVVVDYLQLVGPEGTSSNNQSREREVAGVSRGLRKLSAEIGLPIVALSSFNRDNLKEGQVPSTFNLRDSGAIAFDAEAVGLLHNPAYVPGKPYTYRAITDINFIWDRQRNGPTGVVPLKFIGKYMQFMTESQFIKAFGDTSTDRTDPKSTGQLLTEAQNQKNIWDEDDDDL